MPACSSALPASNREVATREPVSRLKSVVLPLFGSPISPIFMPKEYTPCRR